ncbi:MAG: hypothetical protein Q9164_000713 [Protoblastenia rupestris]
MLHLGVTFLLLHCIRSVLATWPLPIEHSYGVGVLWLDVNYVTVCQNVPTQKSFWDRIQAVLGTRSNLDEDHAGSCQDERLRSAITRSKEDVEFHAFVPWKFHPRHDHFEPDVNKEQTVIRLVRLEHSKLRSSDNKEAYDLMVAADGDVLIRFNHVLGAIHAFTTFTQLFHRHFNAGYYLTNAPVKVSDSPRFGHRALNLDISRNIMKPKDVIRTLDAMALNKFNRLHLHASDAQSWPLEIPALPELAKRGAYHPSQIWSPSDLRQVQAFGFDRGIEVYIEIDMPGHTASIVESHPDLIHSHNRKPWQQYSAQPPSGQLKLNNSNVTTFITTLINDLLPRTAPYTSLFHLGGDEITPSAYDMTPQEVQPYLQTFVNHAISLVQSHGLMPVVWEEHLLDYNLTLPSSTLIQAWRSSSLPNHPSSLAQIVSRGRKALFGANSHWYLDCGHGGWIDPDPANPDSPIKSPFLDYCGPYHNWRRVYSYDPLADVPIEQWYLVVGGEVSMWAEQTDGMNLDSSLWPRLAAAGEVLWRGKGTVDESVTRRLAEMREWLVAKGVAAGPVQVTWCLMNPGNCVS